MKLSALIAVSILIPSTFQGTQETSTQHDIATMLQLEEKLIKEPENAHTYFELGSLLATIDEKKYGNRAIDLISYATQHEYNAQWLFSLGIVSCRLGRFQESLQAYRQIIAQKPSCIPALYNYAYTLKLTGYIDIAIDLYTQILEQDPSYEPAHLGLAFAYLCKGDFKHGWQAHEWNLKKQGKYALELRAHIASHALHRKIVLLTPEGGIGDTIQFIRYAQRLHAMGAYVIVAVQKKLIPLLASCNGIDRIIPLGSTKPPHDAQATLMSLPAIFEDTEETIPCVVPYLFPDQERLSYWHEKLNHATTIKIGICWQPDVHNDISRLPIARRGIPLSYFYKLGSQPGVTLYCLQKNDGLEQLSAVPPSIHVHVFPESFDEQASFVDTAAVIQEMDLIISTDTAIAHLAGALGKPVWLLLPYASDWRWIVERTDSPWYPTMRIFKQSRPFDWGSVMDEVHRAFIEEFSEGKTRIDL